MGSKSTNNTAADLNSGICIRCTFTDTEVEKHFQWFSTQNSPGQAKFYRTLHAKTLKVSARHFFGRSGLRMRLLVWPIHNHAQSHLADRSPLHLPYEHSYGYQHHCEGSQWGLSHSLYSPHYPKRLVQFHGQKYCWKHRSVLHLQPEWNIVSQLALRWMQ